MLNICLRSWLDPLILPSGYVVPRYSQAVGRRVPSPEAESGNLPGPYRKTAHEHPPNTRRLPDRPKQNGKLPSRFWGVKNSGS